MYESGETNNLSMQQPLEINVWRGNGRFELYEDDGETNAYQNGSYAITTFEVSEDSCGIHFTIHAPVGDTSILPEERQFIIRFRDLRDENGGEVVVPVTFTGTKLQLHLSDLKPAGNLPLQELKTDLLTRVQGSNQWKSMVFSKRMPGFVQDALNELTHLLYEPRDVSIDI
jgi:hypothetical protein